MAKLKTENTLPLSKQVEENLLTYIKENNLKEGVKIPNETTLSKTFKVGRSSLREAISRLVTRGVLEVRQGSGTFIIDPIPSDEDPLGFRFEKDSKKLTKDLFTLLLNIEPDICEQASREASEEDIKKLSKICNNNSKFLEFHIFLAKISKNIISENLINLFYSSATNFSIPLFNTSLERIMDLQSQIVLYIKERDGLKAKLTMQELLAELYKNT